MRSYSEFLKRGGRGDHFRDRMQAGFKVARMVLCKAAFPGAGLLAFWLAMPAAAPAAPAAQTAEPSALDTNFPGPQQVLQAYPNEPERVAALVIMRDVIWASDPRLPAPIDLTKGAISAARQLLGSASDAWRSQQGDAYNRAIKQVQADENQSDLTKAQRILIYRGGTGSDRDDHAHDFHEQLFQKFLPTLAAQMRIEDAIIGDLSARAWGLIGICMLITPWLIIFFFGGKTSEIIPHAADASDPLALPESLGVVRLPRLEYPVKVESGLVLDDATWSEMHLHSSTSGGGVSVSSGPSLVSPGYLQTNVRVNPVRTEVSSTNVRKNQIWMLTPDGRELPWTFTDSTFLTRRTQVVSILTRPGNGDNPPALLAYNHSTQKLNTLGYKALSNLHSMRLVGTWFATVAVGIAGGYVQGQIAYHASGGRTNRFLDTLVVGVAAVVLSFIYLLIIGLIYSGRRNRAFRRKYLPAYRQFFEQLTPQLMKHFTSASPTQTNPKDETEK